MDWSASYLMGILYWLYWIVVVSVMIRVVLRNHDTVKTLAWIMVFVFIPFLGLLLYFFFFGAGSSSYMASNSSVRNSLLSTFSTNSISFAPS